MRGLIRAGRLREVSSENLSKSTFAADSSSDCYLGPFNLFVFRAYNIFLNGSTFTPLSFTMVLSLQLNEVFARLEHYDTR